MDLQLIMFFVFKLVESNKLMEEENKKQHLPPIKEEADELIIQKQEKDEKEPHQLVELKQ